MRLIHNKTMDRGKKSTVQLDGVPLYVNHESNISKEYCIVPSFIFRDRSVAVLEALVEYLHDVKKYSFHEIAVMINRNDRTIWTSYRRAKLKRKGIIKQTKNNDDE